MMQVLRIIGFDKTYVKAQGCTLEDSRGEKYLDFLGGYSVFNLGHNSPELIEILKDTLGSSWPNLVQMDAPPLSGLLAEELSKRDPTKRLEYAYFGNSGAEAIECAMKFARAATRRPRLLAIDGGFHGVSMGALSLCGDDSWQTGFGPFLPGCSTIPFGDIDALEKELKTKTVAGLVMEPIQGEGGVREWSQSQWNDIQRLCRKYGTLLILDEIQTGLGRTGKFFAFEHWGIEPDLVCLSKALTNGMVPASVTLGTKKVFESVYSSLDRCMVHSSTFSENNLAMAAALGVLDQLDRQQLIPRAARLGELVQQKLRSSIGDFQMVKEIRGRGLMFAVEFGVPTDLRLRMAWMALQTANKGLFGQMITVPLLTEHHILTQVAGHNLNTLKLSPPLIVNEAQIDQFVTSLSEVVQGCHKISGGIWEFGMGLAKRALTQSSPSPERPRAFCSGRLY
jgi:ornithine--oxo-acid transaminase